MERYLGILYRLARFLAGIPPDAVAYLPAVFERADLLIDFGIWGANAVAGDLFMTILTLLVVPYVWRRLPPGWRYRLRATYEHIFPSGTGDEEGRSHKAESQDGEELKLLREEVRTLHERLEARERRTEEIANRQQREIDRLKRELAEARRPWWRRLFGR